MASSSKPVVHVFGFDPVFCRMLLQKAADVIMKVIRVPSQFDAPDVAELGDLDDVEVLLASSHGFTKLLEAGVRLPNLKWFQDMHMGNEKILDYYHKRKTSPPFVLTRLSISDNNVSEYVICQILASRRRVRQFHDQQKAAIWDRLRNGEPQTLEGSSVVLLGVGAIGKKTAALCNALGMTVYGVTRSPVEKGHGSPDVHHYRTVEELSGTLREADFIVNALPSTPLTRGLLDNDVLQVCRHKKPVFISVGRGDIMTEESILKAVRSEWLSGAVLDVFPKEPLPPDSLLWGEPGVTVTPHIATDFEDGTRERGVSSFLENYRRFVNKQDLLHVVSVDRGY